MGTTYLSFIQKTPSVIMAIRFTKITMAIKKKIKKHHIAFTRSEAANYQKLERSPSQEELENSVNEDLERKIREGLRKGSIVLVLPPPVCAVCKSHIKKF